MDYLVLARKFRPQSFEEVVGQEHVVKTLKNAILQNRVAHAFIFGGPRGVGKTSVARIMAKSLNCEKGPTPTPCQVCANCREITAGTSMDVREIDGASNRGIDEIRELRENVKYSPTSSRYRIFIIDEVHMLTREAFPALLKTLEEPPAHVIFMFATTELHKVPATILSRCQCHDFRMITIRQISEKIKEIAQKENIRISQAGISWIAAAGNGSLRDAQSIFDQVISYSGTDVRDAHVEELLGLADRRYVFMLSEALLKKDPGKCLKVIEEGYYAGFDMKYFYQTLLNHFRNLLFIKIAGKDAALFDLSDDDLLKLQALGEGASRETLQQLLDILLSEEENMRKTQNPRLHLEAVIVRMAYLEELIPIEEILGRMENLEKRLMGGGFRNAGSGASFTANASLPSSGAASDSGMLHEAKEERGVYGAWNGNQERLWEDYKAFVKKSSAPLWSKIEQGRFLGYADKILSLGFPKDYIFLEDLREKTGRDSLAEISRAFFRDDVELKIEIINSDNNSSSDRTNGAAKNNHDIKQEALNHPLLQKVFDIFEGSELREIITRRNNF